MALTITTTVRDRFPAPRMEDWPASKILVQSLQFFPTLLLMNSVDGH
jgi:hypothetical protein